MEWFEQAPVLETSEGVTIVRDDLLDGGSKVRFLPHLVGNAKEVVFGGPFCGGAPLALSVLGRRLGIQVTLFYAKRKKLHRRQLAALENGAQIFEVPYGYMTNVQAKARRYCEDTGALFLPLGFDVPEAQRPFVAAMRGVRERADKFDQVWCSTGSGMLARCLGLAFPSSEVVGVTVGLKSRSGRQEMSDNVRLIESRYQFARETKAECPFPSCPNYDRKAWELMQEQRQGRVLFWNVLG
jgi:hypothetical protein